MQLHPAPAGSDCWAIVTYLRAASATAALLHLERFQPALTFTVLKLREWEERKPHGQGGRRPAQHAAPQPQNYRHQWQPQQPSASWADAEELEQADEPGPAPWRSGSGGWGAVGAEHGAADDEDWGAEHRHCEFGDDDEEAEEGAEEEEYDPMVEL